MTALALVVFLFLGGVSGLMNQQHPGNRDPGGPSRGPQFERFSEESRKALFFARAAVSLYGGSRMENDHLLLGLLEATPPRITRFMAADWSVERIEERLRGTLSHSPLVAESVEIPFSPDLSRVLVRASTEADNLASPDVVPEHLLLALLLDETSTTGKLLREAGVTRQRVEMFLQQK